MDSATSLSTKPDTSVIAHCMPTRSQTLNEAQANREFLTYYQPLDQDLERLNHRTRAKAFTRRLQVPLENLDDATAFFNNRIEFISYTLLILYTRLCVDDEYHPTFPTLIIIRYHLIYVTSLPRCPCCDLPHGPWCDPRFYINLQSDQLPDTSR